MKNDKNLLKDGFATILKEAIDKSSLSFREIAQELKKITRNSVNHTTLYRLSSGEKMTLKRNRRETLLSLIKVLRFESVEKCNQLLQAANYEVLSQEEQEKYCEYLKTGASGLQSYPSRSVAIESTTSPKLLLTESTKKFIEGLFTHFKDGYSHPILLLAQVDRIPLVSVIFAYATTIYPTDRCCHLTLPHATENYFSQIAQRCVFSGTVKNSGDFEKLLNKKLSETHCSMYFLLVSRFEYAPQDQCQELAGILRGLSEQHPNRLHLMLCGGRKLEELKYFSGEHSLFNYAKIHYWPELNRENVFIMRDEFFQSLSFSEDIADQLLTISGGHPTLLKMILQWYQECLSPETLITYPQRLSEEPEIREWFIPYLQEASAIIGWLTALKIAPEQQLLSGNPLLRNLYWKNLMVKRDKWVYWRCEAIRLAGKAVLG